MSSSLAARAVLRSRSSGILPRNTARKCIRQHMKRGFATATDAASKKEPSNVSPAVLVSAIAAGVIALKGSKEESSCDTAKAASPAFSLRSLAHAEPRRTMAMQQPRNVMLHRMRSGLARGLNDKYNVDWKTVLGEGAYGSVHPARLANTGEKVRQCFLSAVSMSDVLVISTTNLVELHEV